MKRIFITILIVLSSICVSCKETVKTITPSSDISLNEQTLAQLGVVSEAELSEKSYTPLNFDKQVGMWFTYMDYKDILSANSKEDFTERVSECLGKMKGIGINTVYLHIRAFGDSYYNSMLFPKNTNIPSELDPLEIFLDEAHSLGLSVHAWINPLRCGTQEDMQALDEKWQIKKWYNDKNGSYIVKVGDYFYLNPCYEEVRSLICEGFKEVAENYCVDGFHIDDYFYPTTDASFDSTAFSASESTDLSVWRTENINTLIKEIYSGIKSVDDRLVLGISPQGNITSNLTSLYADVKKWGGERGYCDFLIPQIYFGFENESCPFAETLQSWKKLVSCDAVKLVVGVCTYKIGQEDKWAGTGKNEWKESADITAKQISLAAENGLGVAVYSFDSTFSEGVANALGGITNAINEINGGDNN